MNHGLNWSLIDHLRWAQSQLWECRWRQFSCVTRRAGAWLHLSQTPFKSWLPQGKDLFLDINFLGVFFCEPMTRVNFFIYFQLSLSNVIIFLAVWSEDTNLTTPLCIFVDSTDKQNWKRSNEFKEWMLVGGIHKG